MNNNNIIENVDSDIKDGGDFLILKNIECIDADDKVFEKHDEVWMMKDIHTNTSYHLLDGIKHFEEQWGNGWFLPSMALSTNILLKLFDLGVEKQSDGSYKTLNENAKRVLDRYVNLNGNNTFGNGQHLQNTIINYVNGDIIHYPKDKDIIGKYKDKVNWINNDRDTTHLGFDKNSFGDGLLSRFSKDSANEHFVRQLTGVKNLEKLIELGDYYGTFIGGKYGSPTTVSCDEGWHTKYGGTQRMFNIESGSTYLGCARNGAPGFYISCHGNIEMGRIAAMRSAH